MSRKLPAFQFYPGDWRKDPNLSRCTHAEKGVWMDMLCIAFECDERGVLISQGTPWTDEEIAGAIGGDQSATLSHIAALLRKGVAKRRNDGAIFSARLVRDESKRAKCSEAGKLGGNPNLTQPKPTLKGGCKGDHKGHVKRMPTPSSSSSVSSSSSDLRTPVVPVEGGYKKDFLEWYEEYPKHVSKEAAAKAYEVAQGKLQSQRLQSRTEIAGYLVERAKAYARSRVGKDPKFTPHPSTWLNQGRYHDDDAEWSRSDSDRRVIAAGDGQVTAEDSVGW